MDAGGREVTREFDLGAVPNSGVEILKGTIVVDNGEAVRRLDGVVSSARLGEVIRLGHWWSLHEMTLESTAIERIPLTIVSDVDGIARSENGVGVGIIEASGILRAVFYLEGETESISAQFCHVTRRETHPGTIERRLRACGTGDGEGVLGERVQDSTGIFQELD